MYKYYNPNPEHKLVGDCVVRAISKLTNSDWDTTYFNTFFMRMKKCIY